VGTVLKKTVTKPLPAGAESFTRQGQCFARWRDRRGKIRTAPLTTGNDGSDRIVIKSSKWFAKYRDGARVVRVVPTGCKDEQAARRVLADLERKAELVRSKVITAAEANVSRHQEAALAKHFDAYVAHLEAAGVTQEHRTNVRRQLKRIAAECSFSRLGDLDPEKLETWLTDQVPKGMGARTRNS